MPRRAPEPLAQDLLYFGVSLFNDKLRAAALGDHVRLINALAPKRCVVSLGDSLHRWNLDPSGGDHAARREVAMRLGDAWIQAEAGTLAALTSPWELVRHDQLLAQSNLPEVRAALDWALAAFPDLAAPLAADVRAFVARRPEASVEAEISSRAYILEELTADIAFAADAPFAYLYPARPLEIYLAVKRASPVLPGVLRTLADCSFLRTRLRGEGHVALAGERI